MLKVKSLRHKTDTSHALIVARISVENLPALGEDFELLNKEVSSNECKYLFSYDDVNVEIILRQITQNETQIDIELTDGERNEVEVDLSEHKSDIATIEICINLNISLFSTKCLFADNDEVYVLDKSDLPDGFRESLENVDDDDVDNNTGKKRLFATPFSLKGRIRRTEYWLTMLLTMLISICLTAFIMYRISQDPNDIATCTMVAFAVLAPVWWMNLAQATKRCHDRGNSGVYQLIPFYFLWMALAPSDEGANRYGTSPK
ncbi:DUF805 domain-containing protein [Hymenobacter yonginensis]|uniref:DUF805 domain-containing protein n=1 Tax=Hymenobacter yonginensis TaxID=748197 RepID=A0ABY7PTY3_9BACT|nr:DUF805 domain-containing protein [Hymenobacter yonginensis]WBO86398.1 DUF805 domain-containing protein [Hymenobacter yonginensis]